MHPHLKRRLRPIAVLILIFFTWFCIEPWNYAVWAQDTSNSNTISPSTKSSSQRFEESLKETKKIIEDLDQKISSGKDTTSPLSGLKSQRQILEQEDKKIKSEFNETEIFLKQRGLPSVIQDRHAKAVTDYDLNFKRLKDNIDSIIRIDKERSDAEKKKDKKTSKAKLDQLKKRIKDAYAHLKEKVKEPPHTPLDPNNLPHRTPKIKPRKPRLNKKEFAELQNPIQLAFNGDPSTLLLVQNTQDLPKPEDLSETIEVQFTKEIKDLASSLNHNPVKIYNWVRNNIDFVPTYGSIQGANMCLMTKQCNDMDTASLLIALLRTSGISARYVIGTIEVPIDKAMNWVGGFTDAKSALDFISSGGTPVTSIISGGKISSAQIEHVWVEAYVDYIPSRGAVHKQGDTWIPMDGSYKKYVNKSGFDFYSLLGFSGSSFLNEYMHDLRDISPYQDYGGRMLNLISTNFPTSPIEDILGDQSIPLTRALIKQELSILPAVLPYAVIVKGGPISSLSATLRHMVAFEVITDLSETVFSYSISLPELRGARVTLSYEPASTDDENLITQYGGTFNVPAYLLHLKPVLKKDGIAIASGSSVGSGEEQTFAITLQSPTLGLDRIENKIITGSYSAIVVQAQKSVPELPAERMNILSQNSKIVDQVSLDDLLGEMLNNIGVSYFYHLATESDFYAKTFHMVNLKLPSEGIVTADVSVSYLFSVPKTVAEGSINIDVDKDASVPFSITGDSSRIKDFMILSGMSASAWEHLILESFYDIPSVSAVKLLKIASQQGIPIHQIDSQNVGQILALLAISSEAKSDIQNAVSAGKIVTVSQTNVQLNNWLGTGYIVLDPTTGEAAYLISGGLAGGGTSSMPALSPRDKASYIDKVIGAVKRHNVLVGAISLIGTLYGYGIKDPATGSIDCSGLVAYLYEQIGIKGLGTIKSPKNAQMQYDYVASINGITTNPLPGDLVFFQATYDKNLDGVKDSKDGVTHVGIWAGNGQFIAAQGKEGAVGVNVYFMNGKLTTEKTAQELFVAYGVVIP